MTTRFVTAAELMSRVLGMDGYKFNVIEHPIASATDDDLRAMAAVTLRDVRALLLTA